MMLQHTTEPPPYAQDVLTFAAYHRRQPVPILPKIVTMPTIDINMLLLHNPFAGIHAAYLHTTRECWLGKGTVPHMSGSLCHELTHYLQDLTGDLRCTVRDDVFRNEIEAFEAQWDYLTAQGTLGYTKLKAFLGSRDNIPTFVMHTYHQWADAQIKENTDR